jgi:hypothetical protein
MIQMGHGRGEKSVQRFDLKSEGICNLRDLVCVRIILKCFLMSRCEGVLWTCQVVSRV